MNKWIWYLVLLDDVSKDGENSSFPALFAGAGCPLCSVLRNSHSALAGEAGMARIYRVI